MKSGIGKLRVKSNHRRIFQGDCGRIPRCSKNIVHNTYREHLFNESD
jgi:hypothetical protein